VRIAAIVLAAGASRRFGSDKRLHPIDGQPMLARTLSIYRQAFAEVAAVIRPQQPAIAEMVGAAGCRVLEAADAAQGQSRSLAAGVLAMRDADALFVALADMPFVKVETLRELAATSRARPENIVRPTHADRPGNPVGFPSRLFDALAEVQGDIGARQVVSSDPCVTLVRVDDAGIHRDIDEEAGALANAPSGSASTTTDG